MASSLSPALAASEQFTRSCGACHTGGGNVVNGGQTLKVDDMKRAGLLTDNADADVAALSKLIALGRGQMYGFGEACAPRGQCTFGARLSDDTIKELAVFVRQQALAGWPQ